MLLLSGSMEAKLLLIYVICQTIITESLGGATLPFSDFIGKVTPIKPKPLSPTIISSFPPSSSLVCESKNKLLSPAPGAREFSSPLAYTSTSRALPVPKIDSISIADVKLPERLREKFVLPKLCCTSTRKTKDIIPDRSSRVSLPNKYPFLLAPSKPLNSLPCFSSWDLCTGSFNKISSVSSMKSLPVVPIEPFKSSSSDILCSGSLPRSRTIDSTLAFETRKPLFSEQFSSNTFSPSDSSSSLPSPLCYKSTYLPRVRTPSRASPLIFRPISYEGAGNLNFPSQSDSCSVLSPKTITTGSGINVNSLQEKYNPCTSRHLNIIKIEEIPKPINPIQLPKTSSNVPVSIKPEFTACNTRAKNLRPSLETSDGLASAGFESRFKPAESLLSSVDLSDQRNPNTLTSSLPNTLAHQISDYQLKPCTCTLPKIMPPTFKPPSIYKNSHALPFVPVSPSSSILDVLSNKINYYDCPKNSDTFDIIPVIGACVETIERLDTNNVICSNCQTGDSRNIPKLEQINLSSQFAPKLATYQLPLFSQECVSKPVYCPPIVPCEPIPTISSGTYNSPNIFCPSRISQTPTISYINQSPPISIAQTTSNIVSSINDVVSNIAQNILSAYQSYINPAPQSIPQRPTYTIMQSNPCDNPNLSILPSPVNAQSVLPIIISPMTDCRNPPTVEIPTTSSSDASCQLPEYEMAASQSLPICLPQPTLAVLPTTSFITYSSPQLCPSHLPSPTLPSYPTISSPLYMEAPVFKVGSSKKDTDVEKVIELMLLAEILNNEENSDWDDLDTLLAFLSLS